MEFLSVLLLIGPFRRSFRTCNVGSFGWAKTAVSALYTEILSLTLQSPEPWILLLDEAMAALDAKSEHLVQEAIEKAVVG